MLTSYTITAEDVAGPFKPIPEDMMKKAALEALGEKFQGLEDEARPRTEQSSWPGVDRPLEGALRHPRHAGAVDGRQDRVPYDPGETYCYYYAHLDRYAEGLAEGEFLKKGDRVGYVGTTGNAPPGTPHLHFTVYKLGADKRWWEGTPINPYPLWALR